MDRITVTIDVQVNDIGPKNVNVRSNLVVSNLISAVKDKFSLDGQYQLRLPNSRRPLPVDRPLDQAGATEGAVLVFAPIATTTGTREAIRRGSRLPFSQQFRRVYLLEARSLMEFDLGWQPAIIGRKDRRDPSMNKLLAVALDEVENATTVSRHHACITEAEGAFFIESISDNNPTYLSDERVRRTAKTSLPAGSRIQVGRIALTFYVVS